MTVDGGRATIRKLFILDLFFLNTDDPLMHNVLTSPVSLGTATEGAHRPKRHKSPGQAQPLILHPAQMEVGPSMLITVFHQSDHIQNCVGD